MDISRIALFSMMKTKMAYMQQRQDVLSQNIANVDTPGYRPSDLKKLDFKRMAHLAAQKIAMKQTHAGHIPSPAHGIGMFKTAERADPFETNPNENAVSIEQEMMKAAENNAEYQVVTSLYKKSIDMFRIAIGRPNG